MLGFLAGLIYANAGEWVLHKYLLHGIGKNKDSYWNFHWKEHHNAARKNDMIDDAYVGVHPEDDAHNEMSSYIKETGALGLLGLAHFPLIFFVPGFVFGVWLSILVYFNVHKASHVHPGWAKKWLPWHYDHHMGKNQDANWCVSVPFFDWIMRTRKYS